jgi:hypothetical protein
MTRPLAVSRAGARPSACHAHAFLTRKQKSPGKNRDWDGKIKGDSICQPVRPDGLGSSPIFGLKGLSLGTAGLGVLCLGLLGGRRAELSIWLKPRKAFLSASHRPSRIRLIFTECHHAVFRKTGFKMPSDRRYDLLWLDSGAWSAVGENSTRLVTRKSAISIHRS